MKKITTLLLGFMATSTFANTDYMTVYKDPHCGCCTKWSEHLRENGINVKEISTSQMDRIKDQLKVPANQRSCHTGVYKGKVFEGHIPAEDIKKFVSAERKEIGLTVPGMPMGSPGMEMGNRYERYDVLSFSDNGQYSVFSKR